MFSSAVFNEKLSLLTLDDDAVDPVSDDRRRRSCPSKPREIL
jgi:hypothetical protein